MLYAKRKPKTKDKYVGIEIEFLCPAKENEYGEEHFSGTINALEKVFINAGLDSYCSLKEDGSINSDDYTIGLEIAVLVRQRQVYNVIPKICKLLKEAGCYVNSTCGMHVHLDMRHRIAEKCFNNLVLAQPLLYAMQPKSRQDNDYCQRTDINTFLDGHTDRYVGINSQALEKFNTLEVRMHSGTVNADKIVNWVRLLVSIADGKLLEEEVLSVEDIRISAKLARYAMNRISKREAA